MDGDSPARSNQPDTLRLYNVESGKELAAFDSAGEFPFLARVFSPDARLLAAVDYNETLFIWNLETKKVVRTHTLSKMRSTWHHGVQFSPDGKTLAVLAQEKFDLKELGDDVDPIDLPQPRVLLFDVTKGGDPEILVCPHGYLGALAFSPDGNTLAVGGSGVHLFDMSKPASR